MNKDLTIYCVGPISGMSYQECVESFTKRAKMLESFGYHVFHPWVGKEHLRNELSLRAYGNDKNPISTNKAITKVDYWRVDNSEILHADFTNAKMASIGTCFEISRAHYQHKLIVTVLPYENIHEHAFIFEASSVIFQTLEESYNYLAMLKGYERTPLMKGYV